MKGTLSEGGLKKIRKASLDIKRRDSMFLVRIILDVGGKQIASSVSIPVRNTLMA